MNPSAYQAGYAMMTGLITIFTLLLGVVGPVIIVFIIINFFKVLEGMDE